MQVSFISQHFLDQIDARLRQMRLNDRRSFGGIPVACFGDFFQLTPPQATPLYASHSSTSTRSSRPPSAARVRANLRGQSLWRLFSAVVLLHENMRSRLDPRLSAVNARLRLGDQTLEDLDWLRGFSTLQAAIAAAPHLARCDYVPIITESNDRRQAYNVICVDAIAQACIDNAPAIDNAPPAVSDSSPPRRLAHPLRIPMKINSMSRATPADLAATGDSRLSYLAVNLDLWPGMPLMVTNSNPATELGVHNGTVGRFLEAQLAPNTSFTSTADGRLLVSKQPEILWIDIKNPKFSRFPFTPAHLPDSAFPLLPVSISRSDFKVIRADGSILRGVKFSGSQFNCLPAFSITCHKCQGMSLDAALIACDPSQQSTGPYVAISRLRSSAGLLFLDLPPNRSIARHWRPSDELADYYLHTLLPLDEQTFLSLPDHLRPQEPYNSPLLDVPDSSGRLSALPFRARAVAHRDGTSSTAARASSVHRGAASRSASSSSSLRVRLGGTSSTSSSTSSSAPPPSSVARLHGLFAAAGASASAGRPPAIRSTHGPLVNRVRAADLPPHVVARATVLTARLDVITDSLIRRTDATAVTWSWAYMPVIWHAMGYPHLVADPTVRHLFNAFTGVPTAWESFTSLCREYWAHTGTIVSPSPAAAYTFVNRAWPSGAYLAGPLQEQLLAFPAAAPFLLRFLAAQLDTMLRCLRSWYSASADAPTPQLYDDLLGEFVFCSPLLPRVHSTSHFLVFGGRPLRAPTALLCCRYVLHLSDCSSLLCGGP